MTFQVLLIGIDAFCIWAISGLLGSSLVWLSHSKKTKFLQITEREDGCSISSSNALGCYLKIYLIHLTSLFTYYVSPNVEKMWLLKPVIIRLVFELKLYLPVYTVIINSENSLSFIASTVALRIIRNSIKCCLRVM